MDELEAGGVRGVVARLSVSEACPLILPYHAALDAAREAAKGEKKIGTTGRGIGPAYEDKVARRAIRLQDLFDAQRFADKLRELLAFHNFVLKNYYRREEVSYEQTLDETLALAPRLAPLIADVPRALYHANRAGKNLLFEGAQGSLLDIDHGTYPYVTSSNCVAGAAAAGAGIGPMHLHYVLGITKAYSTRVGGGPFPTELSDNVGELLRQRGQEFGATTGRPRRTGWFDAAALKRSIQLNGVSGGKRHARRDGAQRRNREERGNEGGGREEAGVRGEWGRRVEAGNGEGPTARRRQRGDRAGGGGVRGKEG